MKIDIGWMPLIMLVTTLLVVALFAFGDARVNAAGDNACETIGTIGNIIVARCIDDVTGAAVIGNSAGMLVPVE